VYPDERAAFYREHEDRAYNVEPFFLSYLTLEIPFEIVMGVICTLFLCIIGFPDTVGSFFLVFFEVFCFVNCGESLGIMFCTLVNHSGLSVNFTSIVNSLFTAMAGYILLSITTNQQCYFCVNARIFAWIQLHFDPQMGNR